MGKEITYKTTVQARDKKGRKTLELPWDIREKFAPGDHVEVKIRKLE